MRKTVAFLIGFTLVLGLGLILLHPSLQIVGLWLTPLLGTQFYVALSLTYLLVADPLKYPLVLFLWLGVAFLGGLIVRRRLGAALTMLLVWLLVIPALAVSAFGVAMNVQDALYGVEGEEILGLIPPVPAGMTFARLLETPILGEAVQQMLAMMATGDGPEIGMDFFMGYAYQALGWVALKPIVVVVGALIGVEVGRLAEGSELGFLPKRFARGDASRLSASLILLVLLGATAAPASSQPLDFGDSVHLEQLLAGADGQGRVAFVGGFLETEPDSGLPDNVAAAIILSQDIRGESLLSLLPFPRELDAGSLLNLVPDTVFAVVFVDTAVEEAMLSSGQVIEQLEQRYGVELVTLQGFELPETEFGETALPRMTAVVGYSEAPIGVVASAYVDELEVYGGLADAVGESVANGALLPGEGGSDGSVYVSGLIRLEPFRVLVPDDEMIQYYIEYLDVFFEDPMRLAVSLHYWENGVTSVGNGHLVDLAELLRLEELPTYSPDSDGSFITLMKVNQTGTGELLNPTVTVWSNLAQDSLILHVYGFLAGGFGVLDIMEGTEVTAESMRMNLEDTPPRLEVTKTVDAPRVSTGREVEVTVSVTNEGDTMVLGVEIDDTATLLGYQHGLGVSGATQRSIPTLAPGATESLSYRVEVNRPGVYRLRSASVRYLGGLEAYTSVSERPTVETGPPTLIHAAVVMRGDLVMMLDMVSGGKGETFVTIGTLVVAAFILGNLALSLWRRRRPAESLDSMPVYEP